MTRNKIKLLLLISISGMIYLCGCNKSSPAPASIVGTWSLNSERGREVANGTTIIDTTLQVSSSNWVSAFTANGYFTSFNSSGTSGGGYIVYGNTLAIYDTLYHLNRWQIYGIVSLTANTLSIQDTFVAAGDTFLVFTQNFSR